MYLVVDNRQQQDHEHKPLNQNQIKNFKKTGLKYSLYSMILEYNELIELKSLEYAFFK